MSAHVVSIGYVYLLNGIFFIVYPAAFVLFVGVVFPLVVVGLWAFWECCHETDREHDDQDDHR